MALHAPSWTDTLRAAVASSCSCLPCLRTPPTDDDEQDEQDPLTPQGSFAARRARADELEGLLADHDHEHDDTAADADAISLHSHLGRRGRRRVPPSTPRHISLWGWNLFGTGKGKGVKLAEEGADPLHRGSASRSRSTTDLLAAAASELGPEQLTEEDVERRARRKARKDMRRMARAIAAQNQLDEAVVMPPPSPHPRIPAPFLHISNPPQAAVAVDDDDDADLDGLAYARRGPREAGLSASGGSQTHSRSSGRSSGSGSNRPPYSPTPYHDGQPQIPIPKTHTTSSAKKSKSKSRSTRSKSSATSSTLASPSTAVFPSSPLNPASREDFGAFVHANAKTTLDTDFDGTPGGFESDGAEGDFDGTPGGFPSANEWEREVVREALPSPGLSSAGGRARMGSLSGAGRIVF
ncbi:hypothetical protein C8F01DRAFT_723521 [Mycena amicta]|nr:hypothetical protein C8F01DRAFT_723521 [Mycena amicta]